MIKKTVVLVVLLSVASLFVFGRGASQTKDHTFKVRTEDSHVGFSIYKWLVIKEEGRFKDFEGTIVYDPESPARTSVEFSVKTASVDSRSEGRDGALRSAEFFHVDKYPLMTFKSVRASSSEKNQLMIDGDLTIRGVAKRVTIPIKILGISYAGSEIGTVAGFESSFIINREDFGVAEGSDAIGKEVTINLLIGANNKSLVSRK